MDNWLRWVFIGFQFSESPLFSNMTKPSFPFIWKSAEVVLPMQRSELCRQRGRKNTKTGLWNKSYILSLTGNYWNFWGSVPCKQSSTHESSDVSYEIFEVVHQNPKELLFVLNNLLYLHFCISDWYLWGTEGYTVYTWAKLVIWFINLREDSFHLTRFFLRWVGLVLVHQRQSLEVTCVDTRMDSQHQVEHPKVSRYRGFCSDLDQGDAKDEIYQYVSLVSMNFMERPVWNPSLSCMVWTWFCTEIHVNHWSIWFEQTYRGR